MKKLLIITMLLLTGSCYGQKCDCIKKKIDKFTGEVSFSSEYISQNSVFKYVSFDKYIKDNDTNIYFNLRTFGATLNINEKGVILLFANGDKIEKPDVKIDAAPADGGQWEYSAYIKLDQKDIDLLSKQYLTDFRLYIYDAKIAERKQKIFQEYAKCILVAN